jgi:hypothetical protein
MAETGQSIGPYQLQGPLEAGGMGEVYRALDPRMGRQVAVKILPESLAGDEERRRFEQEARLAAALNHPNIMAIYNVGLEQHPPYIVGELVPGESLRALIAKGAGPWRRASRSIWPRRSPPAWRRGQQRNHDHGADAGGLGGRDCRCAICRTWRRSPTAIPG